MSFIVISRIAAVSFFAFMAAAVTAAEQPPHILRNPLLGLKYDTGSVKFDPLPADVLAKCRTMADDENERSRMWIYALARDEGRTYYVIAGYGIQLHIRSPEFHRYVLYDLGTAFVIDGDNKCFIFGEARETFDTRYFEETSQLVLTELAADAASRLSRAFGGPDRLRKELRRQHVNPNTLSPELKEAFKPYFGR